MRLAGSPMLFIISGILNNESSSRLSVSARILCAMNQAYNSHRGYCNRKWGGECARCDIASSPHHSCAAESASIHARSALGAVSHVFANVSPNFARCRLSLLSPLRLTVQHRMVIPIDMADDPRQRKTCDSLVGVDPDPISEVHPPMFLHFVKSFGLLRLPRNQEVGPRMRQPRQVSYAVFVLAAFWRAAILAPYQICSCSQLLQSTPAVKIAMLCTPC
jgi:hypothetical protein